jgi:release factor glutamine methyltransferase
MATVRELVQRATADLTAAQCPSPAVDAQLLLAFALNLDTKILNLDLEVPQIAVELFNDFVSTRSTRVPVQHITGAAYFRHLVLKVGPGVFIPRPETELLVQAGLDYLAQISGPKLVVDLCAGSGAVGLSVALESANTTVHAVELSPSAFKWLEENIKAYAQQLAAINSTVICYNEDAGDREVLKNLAGQVDLVLSNPPYIPDEMIPREAEVRDHDPALALFGGEDGLDIARKVAQVAADLLKDDGLFGMEHADVQSQSAATMLTEMKINQQPVWINVKDNNDYNQLPRFVTANRKTLASGVLS